MPADGRNATSISTLLGHQERGRRERALAAIAAPQHGVVTLAQLRSLGLSASAVRARAACGRLHRLHQGVYAVGRADLPVEGRWMAAVLACGPGARLSHASAAELHGLLSTAHARIDVTVGRRAGLARPGIRIHRSTCLASADVSAARGIPCTSVVRTLLDLAAVVPRPVLEKACDQAEVERLLDWAAVKEALARARGRAGIRLLRAVLEVGHHGDDLPRSELERRFLALCRRAGLPVPAVNQWLAVAGEEVQVDFVWHTHGVIVETDGFRTHGTHRAFREDRRRDRLLALAGWRVVRFTWDDLTSDSEHVTRVLRDLLKTPPSR
jgi:hypothetical protein